MLNATVAVLVTVIAYALIISEKIPRLISAFTGAMAMVVLGTWLGFYSEKLALESIDFDTLGLLIGLMVFVSLLKRTGAFEALSVWTTQVTKGNPLLLLCALSAMAMALSMLVNNVTVILFMAPITATITNSLGISVIPFLIAEAVFSNIGGIATLIGDPPNVLIGSAAGFSFTDFLIHLAPIVLVIAAVCMGCFLWLFRGQLADSTHSIPPLATVEIKGIIREPAHLKRLLVIISTGLVLFFTYDLLKLSPGIVALLIGVVSLLLVRSKIDEIVAEIEWNILLFFAALFVIVGGLDAVGVLDAIAEALGSFAQGNLAGAMVLFLWLSAFLSAVIDNIPFTVVMIPIIQHLQQTGLDVNPLWWALALGVGLGGNGTPIGSSAGLFAQHYSERTKEPISFKAWLKVGGTLALVSTAAATALLLLFFWVGWL